MKDLKNVMKGKVSKDLDSMIRTDYSFTANVLEYPLPLKFHLPSLETYDGMKDPLDHIETFKTSSETHAFNN